MGIEPLFRPSQVDVCLCEQMDEERKTLIGKFTSFLAKKQGNTWKEVDIGYFAGYCEKAGMDLTDTLLRMTHEQWFTIRSTPDGLRLSAGDNLLRFCLTVLKSSR